jgi:hypothetical protein
MENKQYILTALEQDIMGVATTINKDRRFLSDTANVQDFKWYPIGTGSDLHAIEITLVEGADVPEADLALLTNHYTSMDIGVLNPDNSVASYISGGEVGSID